MSDSPRHPIDRSQPSAGQLAWLLDRYTGPLVLYARQLCCDPEDAVQAAFIKLTQCSAWPADTPAWLYRVVRNEALQQSRTDRRRREREQAFAEMRSTWFDLDPTNELNAQEAAESLAGLSQIQREVVTARIWGGLAFREIAQLLKVSTSTAHREYQHAIQTLHTELNKPCPNKTT